MSNPNDPQTPHDPEAPAPGGSRRGMSNPNDPQTPRDPEAPAPGGSRRGKSYTGYIIAGAAVVAVILVVMVFTGPTETEAPPPDAAIEAPAPEAGMDAPGDPETPPAVPEQQEAQ
jgi:hypothetical protein